VQPAGTRRQGQGGRRHPAALTPWPRDRPRNQKKVLKSQPRLPRTLSQRSEFHVAPPRALRCALHRAPVGVRFFWRAGLHRLCGSDDRIPRRVPIPYSSGNRARPIRGSRRRTFSRKTSHGNT
jgi:hypothetical protein